MTAISLQRNIRKNTVIVLHVGTWWCLMNIFSLKPTRGSCYTNVFIPCVLSFCQKYLQFDSREPHSSKSFTYVNTQLEFRQWTTFSRPVQDNGNMHERIKVSVLLVKGNEESWPLPVWNVNNFWISLWTNYAQPSLKAYLLFKDPLIC